MTIKFLGVILMTSQLTTLAYGVNYKRLDFEADTYQHRIWSRVPSDDKMVKSSLSFLSDEDKFDEKYTDFNEFIHSYNEANKEIENENFSQFSGTCKKIFEENNSDRNKAAVYMLLEKVREKSLKHLKSLKKLEKFKKQETNKLKQDYINKSLKYFLNVDKSDKIYTE